MFPPLLNARLGTYIHCSTTSESYQAFMPPPLPPTPSLKLDGLNDLLTQAYQALGQLNAVSDILPHHHIMLYYYIRKEAVLSSQIEGTQSSLSDLLMHESHEVPAVPLDDVEEVSSYVAAVEHGLMRLQEGFPLSLRLIREMHAILLATGRGSMKHPGEFRRSQNWIGGSRPGNAYFVPPPPEKLMECLDAFEKYLHCQPRPYMSLIEAGLLHVQFETIHPFLDGNGRIGRLLIIFFLMLSGDLKQPNLYLSVFLKRHRQQYYTRLGNVRLHGDWEGWLDFFLQGVIETAQEMVSTSKAIAALFVRNQARIETLKRASSSAARMHEHLQHKAMVTVKNAVELLQISAPTARNALQNLERLHIVQVVKGSGKEQLYIYRDLLDLLEGGPSD